MVNTVIVSEGEVVVIGEHGRNGDGLVITTAIPWHLRITAIR
jgi:hypothetical protein